MYSNKDKKNKWTTEDSMQRSNWYSLLNERGIKRFYRIPEIKCPQCEQVVDQKWSRCAIGGYFYFDEVMKS